MNEAFIQAVFTVEPSKVDSERVSYGKGEQTDLYDAG